jgi:arginase
MHIDLIVVPYDSAQRGRRMGRGPLHLAERGAGDVLRARGHTVNEQVIDSPKRFCAEPATAFWLQRTIAGHVAEARERGAFPIVLAGNCNTTVGTVSGLGGGGDIGVVWLDAHGDINTPENTTSGFIDGMALSMLMGLCWRSAVSQVPGFSSVPDDRVVLVGARDLDPGELELLATSAIAHVKADAVRATDVSRALGPAIDAVASRVRRGYLHIDLDVHDPAEVRANEYAAPEGLSRAHVQDVVRLVSGKLALAGAALTAYDPDYDADGRMLAAALDLLGAIADGAAPA